MPLAPWYIRFLPYVGLTSVVPLVPKPDFEPEPPSTGDL